MWAQYIGLFPGSGGKSAISLTECFAVRGKSPWMAILGAIRQDAARLRLVRFELPISILLVKSDWKTRLETILYTVPTRAAA
ncbi:MAG: hypothetical protein K2G39_09795 [Lachnospiraceae bacterium]|nr:hypothetical protein [Lachnospiraceae bacterium]